MKHVTLIILLAALFFTALQAQALDIYSRKLNTSTGLPDNNVRNLAQDSKGYIWMGTTNGLIRYDGYFFTTYKYESEGNLRLLNNNHIEGCFPLRDGRMLFREKGGLFSVFDVEQDRFVDLADSVKQRLYDQAREKRADERLLAPFRHLLDHGGTYINDNRGNLVVIEPTGHIWFVDHKTGECIRLKVFDEQLLPLISSLKYKVLTSEKKQLIWVSTNGCGITVYDRRTREERHIRQQSGLVSTDYIQDICLDQQDNLWAVDEFHGLVCLTTTQDEAETHLLMPERQEMRGNQVYVLQWLSDTTLLVANTRGDVFEADQRLRLRRTMTGIDVHAACTDRQGRLWIGSRQQGLRSPDGQWHPHVEGDPQSPTSSNVTALLCDDKGRIWMGCEDGRLELVVTRPDGTLAMRHFLPDGCSPKFIKADSEGTVWVGAAMGLFSFVPEDLSLRLCLLACGQIQEFVPTVIGRGRNRNADAEEGKARRGFGYSLNPDMICINPDVIYPKSVVKNRRITTGRKKLNRRR